MITVISQKKKSLNYTGKIIQKSKYLHLNKNATHTDSSRNLGYVITVRFDDFQGANCTQLIEENCIYLIVERFFL
jgi:hypothetical protein